MRRHTSLSLIALTSAVAILSGCAGSAATWTAPPASSEVPAAQPSAAASAPASAPAGTAPAGTAEVPSPATPSEPAPADPAVDDGEVLGTLEVRAFDLGFEPATLSVPAPGRYEVALTNDGAIAHDFLIEGQAPVYAEAGQTVTGEVVVPDGGAPFICSIPGHAPAGMTGEIAVEGETAAPSADPSPGTGDPGSEDGHGGPPPETDVAADPDAPAPVLYDPAAPARLKGEVHELELVMTEREMTVAPGFVQKVWTFGDTVPGPVMRVKVGDTIRVRLLNPTENEVSHSLDFHSSQVAPNDEMRSIAPGEELIYEWTAEYAGVWMYHCGTAPVLHHVSNGMYGMVIVEPREGLPEVDHEFALVQSEWYLGPQADVTSLEKAAQAAAAPDFVVFNGVANQYQETPLQVETGARVRVFVLNAGPSVDSSFHVIGTIFDSVIKEGVALERGNEGDWGAQAVDLAPAQGAIVEFTTAEDGVYPMVTHAFNMASRGAVGLIQAGDGDPTN